MKTPNKAPAEVKAVVTEFMAWLDELTVDQIGYDTLEDMNDHLSFLKEDAFYCFHQDDEWVVGSNFEDGSSSAIYRDGKWYYRAPWDGSDSLIKDGAQEVIADLKCSITA